MLYDEEVFVKDIWEQGLEQGLRTLVASLKRFIHSPQELYEIVISNECYKNVTFDEIMALL